MTCVGSRRVAGAWRVQGEGVAAHPGTAGGTHDVLVRVQRERRQSDTISQQVLRRGQLDDAKTIAQKPDSWAAGLMVMQSVFHYVTVKAVAKVVIKRERGTLEAYSFGANHGRTTGYEIDELRIEAVLDRLPSSVCARHEGFGRGGVPAQALNRSAVQRCLLQDGVGERARHRGQTAVCNVRLLGLDIV